MSEITQTKGGKKTLLLLAVVFILPFTLAATLHWLDIRPSGKSYGELINPPVALTIPVFKNEEGKPINWQKKWNVVVIDRAGCLDACQKTVHVLGNVRLTLNKDTSRVQVFLLLPADTKAEHIAEIKKQNPDLMILAGADEMTTQFAGKIESLAKPQHIYLIDPVGNLMMQYPQDFAPKGLHGDLTRLIKNSWVG